MLALEIEYLTGRAIAARHNNYARAEWPPHPSRLFSALVCAWGERRPLPEEMDSELSKNSDEEQAALRWLESLPPPQLRFSDKSERIAVAVYVPANDSTTPRSAVKTPRPEVLPAYRPRQERSFPSVTPHDKFFYVIWPEVNNKDAAHHRAALARLAANVISVGHPSSLTRVTLCDDPPEPTHRPALLQEPAEHILRVPSPGRLQRLQRAHSRSEHLDEAGQLLRYTPVTASTRNKSSSVFGEVLVSSLQGPALPLEATLRLSQTLRASLMKHSQQPPLEILSGHQASGAPSLRPHIAIIPLAFVGDQKYADGSIKGLGLILPKGITFRERRHVVQAFARVTDLVIPSLGCWKIKPLDNERDELTSINEWNYVKSSKSWATVTPIVLDRFPRKLVSPETEEIIGLSCERIGLPRPSAVSVCEISPFRGVPPSFAFPALSLNGKPVSARSTKAAITEDGKLRSRLRIHAQLEFSEPVPGPIMLGAGRFLGMGLCRAL